MPTPGEQTYLITQGSFAVTIYSNPKGAAQKKRITSIKVRGGLRQKARATEGLVSERSKFKTKASLPATVCQWDVCSGRKQMWTCGPLTCSTDCWGTFQALESAHLQHWPPEQRALPANLPHSAARDGASNRGMNECP